MWRGGYSSERLAAREAISKLTKSQLRILDLFAELQGEPISKSEIASTLGVVKRTVDRAVMRLRELGLVEARSTWLEDGSQRANSYAVAPEALRELRAEGNKADS